MEEQIKNNPTHRYIRTDLAAESFFPFLHLGQKEACEESSDGINVKCERIRDILLTRLEVKDKIGERKTGKPVGCYITVDCGKIWQTDGILQGEIITILKNEINRLFDLLIFSDIPKKSKPEHIPSVLLVGLGNRTVISDAFGPLVLDKVIVTRHLLFKEEMNGKAEGEKVKNPRYSVSAIAPGVVGQTGIETAELVLGAVQTVSPDIVIIIDALAARNPSRICTTVQLCDTGLSPGSGIGNLRRALNRETLGVPVIALGVPTIVDSSSLVFDALAKAGIENISDKLSEILDNGKNFFVTLKESDIAVKSAAELVGNTLNSLFLPIG